MSVKTVTFFVCIMGMLLTTACSNVNLPLPGLGSGTGSGMHTGDTSAEAAARSRLPALEYLSWVEAASQDVLARESARLEQELTEAGAVRTGVQLAMVRSRMAGAVTSDAALGRSLLLLVPALSENTRAAASADRDYLILANSVAEALELKRRLLRTEVSNEDFGQRVRELEREGEALRSQIEALKSIEEQLYEREQLHEPGLGPE